MVTGFSSTLLTWGASNDADDVVPFAKTKRLISFFKNRGRSISSRCCAGAASAKQKALSKVERTASEAAIMTDDLRIMIAYVNVQILQ